MPVPHLSESQSAAFALLSVLRSVPDQIGLHIHVTSRQFDEAGINLSVVGELVDLGLVEECVIEAPAWILKPWGLWVAGELRERLKQTPDEYRDPDKWGIEIREHCEYVEVRRPPKHKGEKAEILHVPTESPHYEDAEWPETDLVMPISEHESYHGIPEALADSLVDKGYGPVWTAIILEETERLNTLSPKERRKLIRRLKKEAKQAKAKSVATYDPESGEERDEPLTVMGAVVMEDQVKRGRKSKRKAG